MFLTRSGKNRQAGGLGGPAGPLGAEGPVTSGAVATETDQVSAGRFVVGVPSGCCPKGLVVVVTRETAAGTFSLVCTSVRAVSEDGVRAARWDAGLDGAEPLEVRLLAQKAISSQVSWARTA